MAKDPLLSISDTLKILRKKQKVSELTLKRWCAEGLVRYEEKPHGMFKWKEIRKSEVERIMTLLPKERVNGLPLLPRPHRRKTSKAKS